KGSLHKATSVAFRFVAFAMLGAGVSATLAFANDDPTGEAAPTTWNSPPPEFSPMTSHERLGNYVNGLGSLESLVRSVASAGIAQSSGTPTEWGGGAEGFGER